MIEIRPAYNFDRSPDKAYRVLVLGHSSDVVHVATAAEIERLQRRSDALEIAETALQRLAVDDLPTTEEIEGLRTGEKASCGCYLSVESFDPCFEHSFRGLAADAQGDEAPARNAAPAMTPETQADEREEPVWVDTPWGPAVIGGVIRPGHFPRGITATEVNALESRIRDLTERNAVLEARAGLANEIWERRSQQAMMDDRALRMDDLRTQLAEAITAREEAERASQAYTWHCAFGCDVRCKDFNGNACEVFTLDEHAREWKRRAAASEARATGAEYDLANMIQTNNGLLEDLQDAEARAAALETALRLCEWISMDHGGLYEMCPSCEAYADNNTPRKHAADCSLAAALSTPEAQG